MYEGRVLGGKLRIVRELGRGGMGAVYEVYHERLQIVLALKQIVADLQNHPGIQKRFDQEARMMATLRHPNIVRIYDTDFEPDFGSYIVMEFVRGRDLATILRERGALDYREAIRIGIEVASALSYAHDQGVVHRDVKPPNILVEDDTNRPIVTDFGIAKRIAGDDDANLSRTDTFVGTYRYSSREQIRHERQNPIDGRADIYSLGVVLYELVSGHRYLDGMSELNIASCVGYQDSWRPTLHFPDGVPTSFRILLEQCIEPFRDRRVQSATDLITRMEKCLASTTPAPQLDSSPASPSTSEPPRSESEPAAEPPRVVTRATTVTERRAEQRARAVVRLRALRDVVGARSAAYERLVEEGARLGWAPDTQIGALDLEGGLQGIEHAEDRGDFLAAAEELDRFGERLRERNERVEQALATAVSTRLDELRRRWERLSERAAGLVDDEDVAGATSALDGVGIALEEREWRMCRRALERVEALLERGSQGAQRRSAEQIDRFLAQIDGGFVGLVESGDAAAALPWTIESLRESIAALVTRGELAQAIDRAARAWADCELARAAAEQAERASLADAKDACARLQAAVERLGIDADERENVESVLADAVRAEGTGDLRSAAATYRRAESLLERLHDRAERRRDAERTALREEVSALVERATSAAPELVEDAREAAERALASGAALGCALVPLRDARDRLERDLRDEASFAEMARLADQVDAVRDRLEAIARPEDLLPLRAALGEAGTARVRRDWALAAERLRAALDLAAQLGESLERRRVEDAAVVAGENARAAVADLASVERTEVEGERATLLARLAEADTAERAKRYDEAVALRQGVLAKAQTLARRLATLQSADLRTLEASLSDLAGRAQAVAADDVREEIGRALAAIDRIPLGKCAAENAIAATRSAVAAFEETCRERALALCRDEHDRRDRALAKLSALGAPASEVVAWAECEASIGRGRYGEALDGAREARRRAEAELAHLRASTANALAALRTRIDELRSWLDARRGGASDTGLRALDSIAADVARLDVSGDAEEEALHSALRRGQELERRLTEERSPVAARMSELAARASSRIDEQVRALADAPPEIASEALTAAALARETNDSPTDADLARLESAATALEAAAREASDFHVASSRRTEALDAAARIAKARLPWRSARTVRRAVREIESVFRARRWAAATLSSTALLDAVAAIEATQRSHGSAVAEDRTARDEPTPGRAKRPARGRTIGAAAVVALALAAATAWRLDRDDPRVETGVAAEPSASAAASASTHVDERARARDDAKAATTSTAAVDPPLRDGASTQTAAAETRREAPEPVPTAEVIAAVRPPSVEAPAPPPLVRSFSPDATTVEVAEGAKREFRLVLRDPAPQTTIEWTLDGKAVARDATTWTYRPDFEAAGDKDAVLEARVTSADGVPVVQRWTVRATDTNRAPVLQTTSPDPAKRVEFEPGRSIALRVEATDPDGDELTYAWSVGGKAVRETGAELQIEPTSAARVGVVVSDGKSKERAEWQLAAIRPAPLELSSSPRDLARLAFGAEQAFEVKPGSGDPVDVTWRLDDRVVANGDRFVLRDYGAELVRERPVELRARAEASDGRSFDRVWKFRVVPPPPRISGTPAAGRPIDLEPDQAQTFVVRAEELLGGQSARFTFVVDGEPAARKGGDRFVFRAKEGRHRIEAYAEDQFGQRSASLTWDVSYGSTLLTRAKAWLDALEGALNAKDVDRIADLRGLDDAAKRELAGALEDQDGLKVQLGDRRFEAVGTDRVVVQYERTDAFRDARSREAISGSMRLETELGLEDGRIRERGTRRR